MFIRRFVVKNFMIHRSTSVNLHPLTVLVGPNNGGKSSLFDALLNFSMVSRGRLSQAFGPGPWSYRARRSQGVAPAARISYEVDFSRGPNDNERLTYAVSYSQPAGSDPPRFQIFDESLRAPDGSVIFSRSDPDASTLTSAIRYVTDDQSILAAIRRAQFLGEYEEDDSLVMHVARDVSRIGKFRLNPQFLSQASPLPDVPAAPAAAGGSDEPNASPPQGPGLDYRGPGLDYRGEGLATVLYFMAETANPALDRILASLRASIEGFEGLEFNTIGTDRVGFSVKFGDVRGIVAAANLSDGTLSLIGLTVLLTNPAKQPVICIEEPESGLTPNSTRLVYQAVRSVAYPDDGSQGSQVLVSSHSPHVICEAWNGEDRDFIYQVKPEQGRALVRPFSEVVKGLGLLLEKDPSGVRNRLNLNVADAVMDGYLT